jgi:hypothetical protein
MELVSVRTAGLQLHLILARRAIVCAGLVLEVRQTTAYRVQLPTQYLQQTTRVAA